MALERSSLPESLPSRHIERTDQPVERSQDDDVLDPHGPGPGERGEDKCAQHQERLRREDQAATIYTIDNHPREEPHQHHRHKGRKRNDAQHHRRIGQLQHQPCLRHQLHPGANQ